ncbi:hypothetical protein GCM10022221_09810 [Actinocorallia aurea]
MGRGKVDPAVRVLYQKRMHGISLSTDFTTIIATKKDFCTPQTLALTGIGGSSPVFCREDQGSARSLLLQKVLTDHFSPGE